MPRYKPILERFHEKVVINPTTGCWDWQGAVVGIGYGSLNGERSGKHWIAHRFSYLHFKGEIPEGMIVRHRCDNPGCVNPDHLELGTHRDNMDDLVRKGRARSTTEDEAKDMVARFDGGESYTSIANHYGLARPTITAAIKRARNGDFGGSESAKGSKYYTILSAEDRGAVKFALAEGKLSIMAIAKIFKVDRRTVRNIRDKDQPGRYSKLTKKQAEEIVAYWQAGFRQHEIGELFGIDQAHVSKIVRGKSWSGVRSSRVSGTTPP